MTVNIFNNVFSAEFGGVSALATLLIGSSRCSRCITFWATGQSRRVDRGGRAIPVGEYPSSD
jgi:hypothetical protein